MPLLEVLQRVVPQRRDETEEEDGMEEERFGVVEEERKVVELSSWCFEVWRQVVQRVERKECCPYCVIPSRAKERPEERLRWARGWVARRGVERRVFGFQSCWRKEEEEDSKTRGEVQNTICWIEGELLPSS